MSFIGSMKIFCVVLVIPLCSSSVPPRHVRFSDNASPRWLEDHNRISESATETERIIASSDLASPRFFESFSIPTIGDLFLNRLVRVSSSATQFPALIHPGRNTSCPEFSTVLSNGTNIEDEFCQQNSYSSVPVLTDSLRANRWLVRGSVTVVHDSSTNLTDIPWRQIFFSSASLYDYIPGDEYAILTREIQSCGCRAVDRLRLSGCQIDCLPPILYQLWNERSVVVNMYLLPEDYMVPVGSSFHLTIRPQAHGQDLVMGSNILQNTVVVFESDNSMGFCDPI